MPSAFRNSKNLAEWLRLDYFRFPRTLPRLRATLVWLTLFACVFGVGAAPTPQTCLARDSAG
jgi:hypothetical protein